jgi:hypothetical protein
MEDIRTIELPEAGTAALALSALRSITVEWTLETIINSS